jgi:hypothetical protein
MWNFISHPEGEYESFENGVLRRIFGFEAEEAIWDQRKLHNEELWNLYC